MHTVIAAFTDRTSAEGAMKRLTESGFRSNDMHLEHRDVDAEEAGMTRAQWDGQEREIAVDRGVLKSFGAFFASIFGADDPSGHVDTYGQHVERGNFVLVLDAGGPLDAQRANALLRDHGSIDNNMVDRSTRRPLRELLAERQPSRSMGGPTSEVRERAVASDPDLDKVGLRYADKDKPNR